MKIKSVKAREILDSRGNPTLEVEIRGDFGVVRASVPSGASVGKNEAIELRDGGKRYGGKGVLKAMKNVDEIIGPKIRREDPKEQRKIDEILINLDGTENKSRLGANAICGVSLAVCRAGAKAKKIPLWKHIQEIFNFQFSIFNIKMPIPCFNVINGGKHADNNLDLQEFMIVPQGASFKESLKMGKETYLALRAILQKEYGQKGINIGDEGGFAPPLKTTQEALDLLEKSIKQAGYQGKIKIALDCAASTFFKNRVYKIEGITFSRGDLLDFYSQIIEKYPIIFLEDLFDQEDWQGFQDITEKFGEKIFIIGDDLLTTNPKRINQAKIKKACNGLVLKINQIGTVSEALEAAKLAFAANWQVMVANRSGETCDDFIADLAVGIGSGWIKTGAPAKKERMAKYNRLLKIEEELIKM